MRIFIAYGFNARDQWIPDLVFPLVRAFGAEVLTGEQTWGGTISDIVKQRIGDADALVAFTTRRGPRLPDGTYETHRWVTDELAFALGRRPPIPLLEVREDGVTAQRGLMGDRQPIAYGEKKRDRCLVEIAQAVGGWCRGVAMSFHLLPPEFERQIRPLLKRPGFRCTYQLMVRGREIEPPTEGRIYTQAGGLYLYASGVPLDAMIQVQVQANGMSWTSNYEPLDSRSITLAPE